MSIRGIVLGDKQAGAFIATLTVSGLFAKTVVI